MQPIGYGSFEISDVRLYRRCSYTERKNQPKTITFFKNRILGVFCEKHTIESNKNIAKFQQEIIQKKYQKLSYDNLFSSYLHFFLLQLIMYSLISVDT